MRILLQPKQRERLSEIAAQRGVTKDKLVHQIINCYLENDKRFIEAVNIGLAAAERGDFVEHEEVGLRLKAQPEGGLGTEIAALFPKHGLDFVLESPFDLPAKAAGLRPADSRGRLSPHKAPRKSSSNRRKKRA